MKKADAILYFGSGAALAEALGLTPGAISQWGDQVPDLRRFQILERFPDFYRRIEQKRLSADLERKAA